MLKLLISVRVVVRHQLIKSGLVGDVVRKHRSGDFGGAGAVVVLLPVDVPDLDHVALVVVEELVAAVEVQRDAADVAFLLHDLLDPFVVPTLDSGTLAQLRFGH